MNKPDLTPRQLQAQRLYWRTANRFLLPFRLLGFGGWGALLFSLYANRARYAEPDYSPLGNLMLSSILIAVFIGIGSIWAHNRAFDAVRRAKLLDESSETIARTATAFAGEELAFGTPKNRWSNVGLLLFLVAVAALLGWFGIAFATNIAERILTALAFLFFGGYAVAIAASWNSPALSLDERGVFSYYFGFWPRLVRWDEIESAHFHLWTNFHDGAENFTIKLNNAAGQTRLTLNNATFVGAPPGFEARFRAELKRRLTGENASDQINGASSCEPRA